MLCLRLYFAYLTIFCYYFFFFKQKTAYEIRPCDWSQTCALPICNRLDNMVYQVTKESKDWVDKLEAGLKSRLDAAIQSAQAALRSGNADAISKALEELQQAYSAAGASLYAARGAEAGAGAGAGAGAPGGGDGQPG